MGLHRSVSMAFNPVEMELRKRIFWIIRKLDIYVGALLGLPQMLSNDDIDQEMPIEVDDEYITTEKVLPMPPGKLSLFAAFNSHTRLVEILAKTAKYIYPLKSNRQLHGKTTSSYVVNHTKIREIEHDLQVWMEELPKPFRPGEEASPEFMRYSRPSPILTLGLTCIVGYDTSCVWPMHTYRCFSIALFFTTLL